MTNIYGVKKRILLVEDDEDARDLLAFQLKHYELVTASDIVEGLRLSRQRYFDLYILDNWLPDGTGVELCRHIRDFDPNTPILFYSAAGYHLDKRKALSAGAQTYLVKPVRIDELEQAIAELLSISNESAFEARRAEIAAIREELALQYETSAELVEKAKERRLRADKKVLRLKAQIAFLAAGGARGEFARRWQSVYLKEVQGNGDGRLAKE